LGATASSFEYLKVTAAILGREDDGLIFVMLFAVIRIDALTMNAEAVFRPSKGFHLDRQRK
ncbi:MAG: hypothetical protein ACJ8AI_08960, partial [Rhodopila sp.]